MSFLDIILSILSIAIFITLCTLYKRPLKRYPPGPKPWPIIGNLAHLGRAPHQTLTRMVPTYGPLIHLRLGSVHVNVVASDNVASQFVKDHDTKFSSGPKFSGAEHMVYNYEDVVFAPFSPKWVLLRKICSIHLFSQKAMEMFYHVRQEEVAVLTRALMRSALEPVKLGFLLNVCITNAISKITIGKRVFGNGEGTASQEFDEFKNMVSEMFEIAGEFDISDFIPSLKWLDLQGILVRVKKLHKKFDAFFRQVLDDHKSNAMNGFEHKDFLSLMIKMKDEVNVEGVELNDNNFKALLLNLYSAGTDTTSNTIEWALAELMRNPVIIAKAQHEIDTVVGRSRLVSESDLVHLPFMQAITKETLRLHPPAPLYVPRIASEDCEVNGYFISKDSTLLVNIYAIGCGPSVWSEPLKFKPERFLPGSKHANIDIKGNNFEVIPFGAGRRICAGMNLGIQMVLFTIASIIHAFDLKLPTGQTIEKLNMNEGYGITLRRAAPLVVHPRPRLALEIYTL